MDENIAFDSSDFCNSPLRFTPEARKANQALADLPGKIAEQKTPYQHSYDPWLHWRKPTHKVKF